MCIYLHLNITRFNPSHLLSLGFWHEVFAYVSYHFVQVKPKQLSGFLKAEDVKSHQNFDTLSNQFLTFAYLGQSK